MIALAYEYITQHGYMCRLVLVIWCRVSRVYTLRSLICRHLGHSYDLKWNKVKMCRAYSWTTSLHQIYSCRINLTYQFCQSINDDVGQWLAHLTCKRRMPVRVRTPSNDSVVLKSKTLLLHYCSHWCKKCLAFGFCRFCVVIRGFQRSMGGYFLSQILSITFIFQS